MAGKLTCVCCNKQKGTTSFYSHRNPLIAPNMGLCKECAKEHYTDMDSLHTIFRLLNVPFIMDRWQFVMASEKPDKLGDYLRQINSLPHWKELTYKNSDTENGSQITSTEDYLAQTNRSYQENMRFWGNKKYTVEDFDFLNSIYDDLSQDRKPNSAMMKNAYKNIARTQLQAQKALESGSATEFDKLMKTLSTLMGDANVKPAQTSVENNGIESWGEWVRKIEETRPILAPTEEFIDVDGIGKYIKKWFTNHFERVFDLNNSPVEDDLKDEEEFSLAKLREEAMQEEDIEIDYSDELEVLEDEKPTTI